MALNACRLCAHTWHPRGAPLSAKCPRCGGSDGVELAVVKASSVAEEEMSQARVEGYNEKTSQVRWVLLLMVLVLGAMFVAGGGVALVVGEAVTPAPPHRRP